MNHTLLIIDDSKAIRSQIEQIFADGKLFGSILHASDGLEGFKLLVNNDVDIILCDIEMPGIDGLKFLAMMQSREELRDKPVIILTSHDDLETKVRGLESGASDYITKPFEPQEIMARVRVHVQIKALQDELRQSNLLLQELAQTDPLTRLFNRRHLSAKLDIELNRCLRNDKPIALIMADIDHFKQVNDRFGHHNGDTVLIRVAELLRDQLRNYDLAARYGGEEFCLLLPETGLDDALEIAERIRQKVTGITLPAPMQNHPISMSFGVAAYFNDKKGSTDELIQLADAALYDAKNSGRNRVAQKLP